jgi:hypothetical protein
MTPHEIIKFRRDVQQQSGVPEEHKKEDRKHCLKNLRKQTRRQRHAARQRLKKRRGWA